MRIVFLRPHMGKKLSVSFLIVIIVTISLVRFCRTPQRLLSDEEVARVLDAGQNTKRILLWNDFFGAHHFGAPLGRSVFSSCRATDCELWDRLDLEPDLPYDKYDALIFHGIDTYGSWMRDLPLVRRPHQRYVFLNKESPKMCPKFYNFKNFFNWTATYRLDSDFYVPYIDIRSYKMPRDGSKRLETWREPTFQNMTHVPSAVAKKTRLVAWFVSNSATQSKRELYAGELAKYISVDIYGRGRKLRCDQVAVNCDLMLDTSYKFYLAFENSLCVDYVTEKFLRALSHHVVPIVYGGADYRLFAPPMSYINVKDFESPRALARYLHYLDKNPAEYRKYFWWKRYYAQNGGQMWCDICERLHDPLAPRKVYSDIGSWWNYEGACVSPQDIFDRNDKSIT